MIKWQSSAEAQKWSEDNFCLTKKNWRNRVIWGNIETLPRGWSEWASGSWYFIPISTASESTGRQQWQGATAKWWRVWGQTDCHVSLSQAQSASVQRCQVLMLLSFSQVFWGISHYPDGRGRYTLQQLSCCICNVRRESITFWSADLWKEWNVIP